MVLEFSLSGREGFAIREKAFNFLDKYATTTGAERGTKTEQGSGLLAEVFIRHLLHLADIENDPDRHTNLGYDILSPTGVKIDVKCRGGVMPFQESYSGSGSLKREAKHNFFARQVYDNKLDTDIYLMTHLRYAGEGELPGTIQQKNWTLYVCGWVSKERVKREGVYLPRGSLTEQGNTWFTYRGQEIEFFHRNLNFINRIEDVLTITTNDVELDKARVGFFNLTSVDAVRIALDLYARGLLNENQLNYVKSQAGITTDVQPILSVNQYLHLAEWLFTKHQITQDELKAIKSKFHLISFTGI